MGTAAKRVGVRRVRRGAGRGVQLPTVLGWSEITGEASACVTGWRCAATAAAGATRPRRRCWSAYPVSAGSRRGEPWCAGSGGWGGEPVVVQVGVDRCELDGQPLGLIGSTASHSMVCGSVSRSTLPRGREPSGVAPVSQLTSQWQPGLWASCAGSLKWRGSGPSQMNDNRWKGLITRTIRYHPTLQGGLLG